MFGLDVQKEIIANIRSFFKTTLETLDIVQNQTERAIDFLYSQGIGFQEEYINVLKEWLKKTGEMRRDFMKLTEDYLLSIERLILEGDSAEKGKKETKSKKEGEPER